MKPTLAFLLCLLSFYSVACDDHSHGHSHSHSHEHKNSLPKGVELTLPAVAEGDNGKVEFDIHIDSEFDIDNLAIKLLPNPRVKLVGNGEQVIENQLAHKVKAEIISGPRGAIRVVVSGTIEGKAFLVSRFVMLA
ncbi:hypothetical protein [Shewanella sp. TC10]|uniref:hypothetical protein n=1 Tax=Shewanella sp. TC10 TaxID=1419739 RepID=UPI00129EE497|nr:hypothetical protein [Shewanella sp. TC10]